MTSLKSFEAFRKKIEKRMLKITKTVKTFSWSVAKKANIVVNLFLSLAASEYLVKKLLSAFPRLSCFEKMRKHSKTKRLL